MTTYYIMLCFITAIAFVFKIKELSKYKKICIYIIGIALIIVSGFRYNVGTDYFTYTYLYDVYKNGDILGPNFGLVIVAKISQFIYDDYSTWFFIMSLITIIPVIMVILKRSTWPILSIYLFVFMGMWHTSFNIVKQSAAMAILFMAQGFLINREFRWWMVACAIASTFHSSAILMVPIYFLVHRKIDFKQIMVILGIGIFISVSYEYLFNIADTLKQGESLTYIDSALGSRGVNSIRILVNCMPAIFYLIIEIKNGNKGITNQCELICANMTLLNSAISIGSMNSVYLTRFALYTNIYSILLVPIMIDKFSKSKKYFISIIIVVLYSIYWYYDISKTMDTSNFQWIFERYSL